NAMEARRDRAFHLSLRAYLCVDADFGGSRISLSCGGERTGARSTADRHQIERIHFRAPGGLAAVSGSWRTGKMDRWNSFARQPVYSPQSRTKIFREFARARDRPSGSSPILFRWHSLLVE